MIAIRSVRDEGITRSAKKAFRVSLIVPSGDDGTAKVKFCVAVGDCPTWTAFALMRLIVVL
jgi:hypothetical protein